MNKLRITVASAALFGLMVGPVATASASSPVAKPPLGPATSSVTSTAPQQHAPGIRMAAAAATTFQTRGDYAHVTYTTGRREVSGHGWWLQGTTKATKAVVTIWLQTSKDARTWTTVGGPGKRTLSPGRSRSANVRWACNGVKFTYWRTIVDVDLVGVIDTDERLYTPARGLTCGR